MSSQKKEAEDKFKREGQNPSITPPSGGKMDSNRPKIQPSMFLVQCSLWPQKKERKEDDEMKR